MAASYEELQELFFDELGRDVGQLAREPEVCAWLNAGIGRLPARYPRTASVTWAEGASEVALPADFVKLDRVEVTSGLLQPYTCWGTKLRFYDPLTVSGAGVVFYFSRFPSVSTSSASALPPAGDEAIVFYALWRFFRKIASARADFRRYSTITGQSGLDVSDLDAVAERYRQDFLDARAELEEDDFSAPATFFGE